MKGSSAKINKSLIKITTDLFGKDTRIKYTGGEPPIRSVLFSADQMEQHGRKLADSHILGSHHVLDHHLLERLAENEVVLKEVHEIITEAVRAKRQIRSEERRV